MGHKWGLLILGCCVAIGCSEGPPAKLADRAASVRPNEAPQDFARVAADSDSEPIPNTESYHSLPDNRFQNVAQQPLSTFSIDVDTASYANVRRFLTAGQLPPRDAVRIEEMLNYFTYDYPQPIAGQPFAANVEIAACPWKPEHRLVRIGLRGRQIDAAKRPVSNLVFLLDVSGSMQALDKLPLLKQGMKLLVDQLTENDRVAIVVYAGASGVVLQPTTADHKRVILSAIDNLQAGGSTNGAAGIEQAYQLASQNFIKHGTNRVILCTDGDFNVGQTSDQALEQLIEDRAKTGVFLSVLGFGTGNLKDSKMELLADKGNGNYAYIDSLHEARKVLVDQMQGTLITIAKNVKIQIEFNPARAAAYRLIGYENRLLAKEDFQNDKKDAGEIGAGHTVTALYEVVPAGESISNTQVEPLKYQSPPEPTLPAVTPAKFHDELLTLKLRYKQPEGEESQLSEFPIADQDRPFAHATPDFAWASAVAAFGMILRDSDHKGNATLASVLEIAESSRGQDPSEYRAEFIRLVKMTIPLMPQHRNITQTP